MEKSANFSSISLSLQQKIAFICSPKLGDTLISLIVPYNLQRNGYKVTIYGDFAYALRDWFPWVEIHPAATLAQLNEYDLILHMYPSELAMQLQNAGSNSHILSESPLFRLRMSLIDIQVAICEQILGLQNLTRENGLQPLPGLVSRKYQNRVLLHPMSGQKMRNWPASKFIALADILRHKGLQPQFILSPAERIEWQYLLDLASVPQTNSLSETAAFIYESAWFIGNDSGIGHLASNLGVPTLSMILRPSLARQWRPNWSYGEVILPPAWLITRPLKEKFWKYTISVNKVLHAFETMTDNYLNNRSKHV